MNVPIEISARHVHLSLTDLETLFGKGYKLHKLKDLSQIGEFASQESVDIVNGDKIIKNVRIVGPLRDNSQVEISKTDSFNLGIETEIRVSGDIAGTSGIVLVNGTNKLTLTSGLITPQRHLHISPEKAESLGLKHGQTVSTKVLGKRALVYNELIVRSRINKDTFCVHLDTDEANAAWVSGTSEGEIIV